MRSLQILLHPALCADGHGVIDITVIVGEGFGVAAAGMEVDLVAVSSALGIGGEGAHEVELPNRETRQCGGELS